MRPKITRRALLKGAALAAGSVAAAPVLDRLGGTAARADNGPPYFLDPLPLVPSYRSAASPLYPGADYYEVQASQLAQQLSSRLPASAVWGYGSALNGVAGRTPGAIVEAAAGRPVVVRWANALPTTHLLHDSIDPTLFHGIDYPEVRMVTHLHGGFTAPQFDGHPEAWVTPTGQQGMAYRSLPGAAANEAIYAYSNAQRATMLWYHDHTMSVTRLNVYAGLAGLYRIRDGWDTGVEGRGLPLPVGRYEVPLVLQDKSVASDGTLVYPTEGATAAHPIWQPEFFGDLPVVNGAIAPFLEVEPRRYRLRILNASQARFYHLWFEALNRRHVRFHVIGTDGGLLPRPVALTDVVVAPAERLDLIVDFGQLPQGATVALRNDARTPFPDGDPNTIDAIMQFRVGRRLRGRDWSAPPDSLRLPATARLAPTPGLPPREIAILETEDPATGEPLHALLNEMRFEDPSTETPRAGTTEVWQFINTTEDAHPMHVHLVQFQVLNRQPFDADRYDEDYRAWVASGRSPAAKPVLAGYLSGPARPPRPEESGWKDTAKAYPGEVLRIVARFDVPPMTTLPADYVYHCHILEHEDNEMMRPFTLMP